MSFVNIVKYVVMGMIIFLNFLIVEMYRFDKILCIYRLISMFYVTKC